MRLREYHSIRLLCTKCPSFLASLVISFTFVACTPTSPTTPVSPSAPEEALLPTATQTCPTFEQACADGKDYVDKACALDKSKKEKPGQIKKCRREALNSYLAGLSSCFNESQLHEIRLCILGSLPPLGITAGGAHKEQFHADG